MSTASPVLVSSPDTLNWWDIQRKEWSFTQPLEMDPLSTRIKEVLGKQQADPTPVVRNPQLQRLKTLLDDKTAQRKRSGSDLLIPPPGKSAPVLSPRDDEGKRREAPTRKAKPEEEPKQPEPVKPAPEDPKKYIAAVPSNKDASPRQNFRPMEAPREAAPNPPSPSATSPLASPPASDTPSPTPTPAQPAPPAPASPPATPAAPALSPDECVVNKKELLQKLSKLDDLMEELELDFTEVMVSEFWEPIREIVKDITTTLS